MPLTHELFTELSRANWKQLLDGEAKPHLHLYEFGVANTTYHKKIITIDEKTVYLGSTNLGEKSLRMNDHEINVRMESPAMAALVFNVFQQDTQSRGSEGPMAPEVPQREVLSTEINRAAIAEVQSSLLQRWL